MTAWLLDTCVIVDYLRDRPEAVAFVGRASDRPAVSAITAAELFAGARTTTEERRIEDLLHQLAVHDVDLEVARLGGGFRRRYGQSHGVLIPDALIAATARALSPATPATSRCSTTSWCPTSSRPAAGSRDHQAPRRTHA